MIPVCVCVCNWYRENPLYRFNVKEKKQAPNKGKRVERWRGVGRAGAKWCKTLYQWLVLCLHCVFYCIVRIVSLWAYTFQFLSFALFCEKKRSEFPVGKCTTIATCHVQEEKEKCPVWVIISLEKHKKLKKIIIQIPTWCRLWPGRLPQRFDGVVQKRYRRRCCSRLSRFPEG